ncbi:hypothetical protein [Streptomyces sp. S.PB5]|uniref:hypothetical protein n=1 Tax=Streptomyces sp. S.PB5 TaxID=3020844 RepID=UPI0025B02999|nr:hypothetical protein [Streptomyces sp. S.PB5]MDN3023532.1 hypothetical protein [Streptomyces sp. S.PB5]
MRTALVEAATGFPVLVCTAALVVVAVFWLLVVSGAATVDSFDTDIDLGALGMGGVPVAVALSLLAALSWLLGVGAALTLAALAPTGPAAGMLRLVVPVAGLLAAWWLTCLFVRPLHRLFPDEPGPGPGGGTARNRPV